MKKIVWLMSILFVAVNSLLVFIDSENKVERKAFITQWETAYEADLVETIQTDGVVSYKEENYVYFDDAIGSFHEFLTEEGSIVTAGDPLFSYKVTNYGETETALLHELNRMNGEINAIEQAMTEMAAYEVPRPTIPVVNQENEDEEMEQSLPRDPIEADLMKEQYLIEKEKELTAAREAAESIQSQLQELQTSGDTIIVESPVNGKIKEVSNTLHAPLITILSEELHILGELKENDRIVVEEGMAVEINFPDMQQQLQGVIQQIADSPSHAIQIELDSVYSLEVDFENEAPLDGVLPGYHTELAVVVNEAPNATVVDEHIVVDDFVWKITEEGTVVRTPIQRGMTVNRKLQIIEGVSIGDNMLTEHKDEKYSEALFITPLSITEIPWKSLLDNVDWKKNLVRGILAR